MNRLLVILGVAGVSLSAVFVRWSAAPSLVLVLYRMAFASILLAPVAFAHRAELRSLPRKTIGLCLVSGAFLGGHFTAYFAALSRTGIASAVLLVDTEVFFVALATVFLFHQSLSRRAWLAIALAFGGSVMVALSDGAAGGSALLGDCIALAGAASMAVYTMIGSVCRKTVSTTAYTTLVYLSAAVTVLAAALVRGTPLTGYSSASYAAGLGMAVFCTLLGHSVFSWGLKTLPAAFISMAKLLEPVFASVWGLALFGERPGGTVLLGGAVILLGIGLYSRAPARSA